VVTAAVSANKKSPTLSDQKPGCLHPARCSSAWADSFNSRWPVEARPVPLKKKCRFCNEGAGSHTISSIAFIQPAVRLLPPAYCARAEDKV
jgi:hypothetical protein